MMPNKIVKLLNISCVVTLLVNTAGCKNDSPSLSSETLNGTWFNENVSADSIQYSNEQVITEKDSTVVIRSCSGSTTILTRLNNNLYLANGDRYFLDIQDSNTLTYVGDVDGGIYKIKKLYDTSYFDSGAIRLTFDSVSYIDSDFDICASRGTSTYTDYIPNTVIRPDTVRITAPYLDSYIQITILFKELNNQIYDLVGLNDFLIDGMNTAHIQIMSPEFANQYPSGISLLSISAGSIEILESTHPDFRIIGIIYSDFGEQIEIDADLIFR